MLSVLGSNIQLFPPAHTQGTHMHCEWHQHVQKCRQGRRRRGTEGRGSHKIPSDVVPRLRGYVVGLSLSFRGVSVLRERVVGEDGCTYV